MEDNAVNRKILTTMLKRTVRPFLLKIRLLPTIPSVSQLESSVPQSDSSLMLSRPVTTPKLWTGRMQ